ncbi:helix-turn-helix domain-containing protein [Paraburkholderia sp. BL21I4N1]|uniref:helix-turn-helix domain-containing protein n=1 Tax=Paraburkholderia sp. BL21I4N1 TaxID=1938801 RepID=UPI000CFBE997|nr:helix-turn-helix domain-containing protein [Paraburkholderia sp. BL21I4N1]PQV48772.1 helix-turn-helix protein [Paraburkholderia sp. BL21I4N1]
MSFRHLSWALKKTLPCREKIVLVGLADHMNRKTGRCFPSHATIAEKCGLSEASVKRALIQLEEHRLITIVPRSVGAARLSNQYDLHLGNSSFDHASKAGVTETRVEAQRTDPGGAAPGGEMQNGNPVGAQGATNLEGSQEGKQEKTSAFDRWWKIWPSTPRKVAWSECQKLWKENELDAITDQITAHTEAMKKSTAWRDGWEPSPKTYLTGRRWLDGVPPDASELVTEAGDGAPGWWDSASGIEAQGRKRGISKREAEAMPDFFLRVARASGPGEWIVHALKRARDDGPTRLQHVIQFFGEELVPAGWWPMD